MLKKLLTKNRSYRRFHQDYKIEHQTLAELIDMARLCPSGANLQPLKYILSCDAGKNALIFERLVWAGYLKDWAGPAESERPSAYIIILGDTDITKTFGCDHGITAQSILLGAVEKGLGGCMVGSIHRKELAKSLKIPPCYEILLALALGKPKEQVTIESTEITGDIKYYRDNKQTHHVPKRPLDEIIIG
ncbi:nitroreductase family protein [Planctomycetota bacterium]